MKWMWLKPFLDSPLKNSPDNRISPKNSMDYIKEFYCKKCSRNKPLLNYTAHVLLLVGMDHRSLSNSGLFLLNSGMVEMFASVDIGPSPSTSNDSSSMRSNLTWDPEIILKTCRTDAYGIVHLKNNTIGSYRPSDYVRLEDNTPMDKVLRLFSSHWSLMIPQPPKLAISIIGQCKNFGAYGTKKENFVSGLINYGGSLARYLLWMMEASGSTARWTEVVLNWTRQRQDFEWF
ncbi:Transient receptor potential cation channel subfamily A member 1-like 14, partial [Homarus americanus]